MDVLKSGVFSTSTLQAAKLIIEQYIAADISDAAAIIADMTKQISNVQAGIARPSGRRRPDNLKTCSVCGSPAVIVPLSRSDRGNDAITHAIQCQNRPGTDQPWLHGMCGHTEYVMRGPK